MSVAHDKNGRGLCCEPPSLDRRIPSTCRPTSRMHWACRRPYALTYVCDSAERSGVACEAMPAGARAHGREPRRCPHTRSAGRRIKRAHAHRQAPARTAAQMVTTATRSARTQHTCAARPAADRPRMYSQRSNSLVGCNSRRNSTCRQSVQQLRLRQYVQQCLAQQSVQQTCATDSVVGTWADAFVSGQVVVHSFRYRDSPRCVAATATDMRSHV